VSITGSPLLGSGTLGGAGTVGTVNNISGIVDPGSPGFPNALSVNNLTLGPGTLVLDLSDTAPGSDSVNVLTSADITGATLSLNVGTVVAGDTFTILNIPIGGLTGSFVGLPSTNSTFEVGGVTYTINYAADGGTAVTISGGASTPSVSSTMLNGGIALLHSSLAPNQHSMVENIVYSFSQAVNLSSSDFTLTGIDGTTTVPNVNVSGSGTNWTVTFSGLGVNALTNSIGDGDYQLVLSGAGLTTNTFDFYRLYGDIKGDGDVSTTDFSFLVGTFLRSAGDPLYLGALDVNNDGTIGTFDFSAFTSNFLKTETVV
jgi:hypothetical protein